MKHEFPETYKSAVELYVQRIRDAHTEEKMRDPNRAYFIQYNRRFTKVVEKFYEQDQVFCFIDPINGDILKSGTWNAPQPNGKRGNIYTDQQPLKCGDFYVR